MISIEEIEFYKDHIDEFNVVFDVGCQHDNVFDELKPGIEVHLFDPTASGRLEDKIAGKANIHYNQFALGNYSGKIGFHEGYGSILHRPELDSNRYNHAETEVAIDTLFNYCDQRNIRSIDLLKIDTEGYDFEVIKGAKEELLKGIKYVQFEEWDTKMVIDIMRHFRHRDMLEDVEILKSNPRNYIIRLR